MKKHKTLSIRQRTIDRLLPTAIILTSLAFMVVAWSTISKPASAITPPDSCFAFSGGTITGYYDNENDDPGQPACPTVVDVPGTIDDVAVVTVGSSAFAGSGVTSIAFPASLTTIQENAFTGLTLTSLSFSSTGNLAFESQSFNGATLSLTNLNITVGGNLSISGSLNGLVLPGALTLQAAGNVLVTNASLIGVDVGSLNIVSTGGSVTVTNGSFGGNSSVDSTIAISAAGAMELSYGAFQGLQNDNPAGISIDAGGNIQMTSGGMYEVNLGGPLAITSGGAINMLGGILEDVTVPSISIQADGSVTMNSGVISGVIPSGVSIDAGDDVSLLSSSLTNGNTNTTDISGALTVHSGGSILVSAAVTANGFTSVELIADSGIEIQSSALNTNPVLTNLTFSTQTGLIDITGHSFVSNGALEQISITAPEGLTISDALYNIGSPDMSIDVSGDVLIDEGSFVNAELDSLDIDTDGSITIGTDAFGGIAFVRHIDWRAGEDLTITDDTRLDTWSMLNVESIRLNAGQDLSVGDRAFNTVKATTLDLLAGNSASFGDFVLSGLQITELSLPATTTHIGSNAFSYSKIQSVRLNGSTPVINDAFKFAGASVDIDDGYSDLDQIHYVQLYTDNDYLNPGGYSSTLHESGGGYIVNPATYTVNYQSTNGDTLAPSLISGTGPTLTSYLMSENPTGDFDLYYKAGNNIALTAPSIADYIAPAEYDLLLSGGENEYTFIYNSVLTTEDVTDPDVPNTGSLSFVGNVKYVIWASVALALLIGLMIVMKKIALKRR